LKLIPKLACNINDIHDVDGYVYELLVQEVTKGSDLI